MVNIVRDGRSLDENGMIDSTKGLYPCPVCETPNKFFDIGCYDICDVCGWQDDDLQYDDPNETGINNITYSEAKRLWDSGRGFCQNHHPKPQIKVKAS
jgi:hypothetical protein